MRNIIMQLNIKSMLIIGVWSIICTASIVVILVVSHDRSTETIKDRLDFIELQLAVKTADRYHGSDARRDFGELRKQLDEIRNDCDCERKKM
jgi:hypothetical protein